MRHRDLVRRAVERRQRAFTLIELLVVIAILAILVAILLPAIAESRKVARKVICEANMRQFGIAGANYATDFQDRIYSFTWRQGKDYGFGGVAASDNAAAANQAVDILRRRADRTDITAIPGWTPHVLYSHLVLNDYLQQRLPEKMVVCPEDRQRLRWQESVFPDYNAYFQLIQNVERPPGSGNSEKRWPYSSSYAAVPASYSPDQMLSGVPTVEQSTTTSPHHSYYFMGNGDSTRLGTRKLADVTFVQSKVWVYDRYSRHFDKRQLFYAYPQSKAPLLFFDGSVTTRTTRDANPGFRPNSPLSPLPLRFNYEPPGWEPGTLTGQPADLVTGYYQWTRGGLSGVDFGGGEVAARRP